MMAPTCNQRTGNAERVGVPKICGLHESHSECQILKYKL